MHTIQYLDLFVPNRERFNMNSGNKNPLVVDEVSSFSQLSTSSPLVFDSVKKKSYFVLLNDSNSFGTEDHDAHISTQIDCSIIH